MPYPSLGPYAAPAAPRSEIWRTFLGLALIGVIAWGTVLGALGLMSTGMGTLEFARLLVTIERAGSPEGMAMLLATFVPMALAVIAVTRALHGRSAMTLFGPGAARDFQRVVGPLVGLGLLMMPFSVMDENVGRSVPLGTVLRWLPLALPLLMVQIAAEELIFRGYLLQQLAARTRTPLVWMVVPAMIFGLLHYAPGDYGAAAIPFVLWAIAFGCLAADLTARAGNLGPALAFHFANNVSAMFLVGLYGQLDGLSLYTIVVNARDPAALAPYLAIDSLSMLASWLMARLILRR